MTVAARPPARSSTLDHWESYWKDHADLDQTYSTGGRLAREVQADGEVRGRVVLEVGAGSGRDTLELVRAGAIGVVLDYSPASLELVKRQAATLAIPVHLVRADALAMPFRDASIDVVHHQGLLEHFRDPMPLLRENVRVARPGGRVVVDVPQTFHLYTVMKQIMIAFNVWFAGWETQFTPAGLERRMSEAGLTIRRSYGDWMVPGLGYRVFRETLRRTVRLQLPLEPAALSWWWKGTAPLRRALSRTRFGLYTCHVIGTVGVKA